MLNRLYTAKLSLLASCMMLVVGGCSQQSDSSAEIKKQVYYCTVEKTFLAAPVIQQFPGKHPETGAQTLMPARYCMKCKQWYPVPQPEILQRSPRAGLCPKTQTPLSPEGPLPEKKI